MNTFTEPGTAMSNVEMMPISAYARAQNGSASGSLQHSTLNRKSHNQLTIPPNIFSTPREQN